MSFGQFIRLASMQNSTAASPLDTGTAGGTAASCAAQTVSHASDTARPRHYYLAQADIAFDKARQPSVMADCRNSSHDTSGVAAGQAVHRDSLSALAADLQPPPLLSGVASELQTHLWMSIRHGRDGLCTCPSDSHPLMPLPVCLCRCTTCALCHAVHVPTPAPADCRGSRSSLHYDPYQNLLCVVRGSKTVRLHSPEHTAALYPQPAHGEVCMLSAACCSRCGTTCYSSMSLAEGISAQNTTELKVQGVICKRLLQVGGKPQQRELRSAEPRPAPCLRTGARKPADS
jgi:Cupin-like domain